MKKISLFTLFITLSSVGCAKDNKPPSEKIALHKIDYRDLYNYEKDRNLSEKHFSDLKCGTFDRFTVTEYKDYGSGSLLFYYSVSLKDRNTIHVSNINSEKYSQLISFDISNSDNERLFSNITRLFAQQCTIKNQYTPLQMLELKENPYSVVFQKDSFTLRKHFVPRLNEDEDTGIQSLHEYVREKAKSLPSKKDAYISSWLASTPEEMAQYEKDDQNWDGCCQPPTNPNLNKPIRGGLFDQIHIYSDEKEESTLSYTISFTSESVIRVTEISERSHVASASRGFSRGRESFFIEKTKQPFLFEQVTTLFKDGFSEKASDSSKNVRNMSVFIFLDDYFLRKYMSIEQELFVLAIDNYVRSIVGTLEFKELKYGNI